ncbi:MAG: ribonuclease Z [Bacteroidota bacterium]
MNFSVTILGSGAAIPLTHRNPSAHLINVHEKLFLFDCAEGTQVQLRRNHVRIQRIEHIFISHLHGDHYFGLMGLITTLHLLGREAELHLYAPPALEKIIQLHLESSQTILRYPLTFHALDTEKPEIILDNKSVTVQTIPMKHNFPTCGFLIREKQSKANIRKDFLEGKELSHADYRRIKDGNDYVDQEGVVHKYQDITIPPQAARAYAYCTDTAYDEEIIPLIKDVDLLYHEATFMEDRAADAEAKFHSTAKQAARIALKAEAKKLLIGHYSARYRDLEGMLEEAKEVFQDTILADDGMVVEV